jgi:Tol biopolymer transport system component
MIDRSAIAVFLLLSGCFPSQERSPLFEEKLLSTIPQDALFEGHAAFSPDGSSVAYIINRGGMLKGPVIEGGRYRVIFRNQDLPEFRQIAGSWGLEVSADGSQVAYSANDEGNFRAMLGSTKLGEKYNESGFPQFSLDGKSVIYWATDKEGQSYLVLGDRSIAQSDGRLHFEGFSPDGKRVAYLDSRYFREVPGKAYDAHKYVLKIDGKKVGEEFDGIDQFRFSPTGDTFAYVGHEGQDRSGCVVVGNQKGPAFKSIYHLVFSPDGKKIAYNAWDGSRTSVIFNGKDVAQDYAIADSPSFAPDGTLAFAGESGKKGYVVLEKKRWEVHGAINWHPLVVSPDGTRVAYAASTEKGEYVGVGDQEGELCDTIFTPPIFSADGKKIAYGALKGREFWWKVLPVK